MAVAQLNVWEGAALKALKGIHPVGSNCEVSAGKALALLFDFPATTRRQNAPVLLAFAVACFGVAPLYVEGLEPGVASGRTKGF